MNRTMTGPIVLSITMLFLLGPFAIIAAAGFSAGETLAFPPEGLSFRWFGAVFREESFRGAFAISFFLAAGATVLALLLGVPAAYALDRYRPRGTEWIRILIATPFIVPGILVGLALLQYLVIPTDLGVLPALFIAHTALLVPYAMRVVSASLANLRVDIEEAAMMLGASRLGAFRMIVLPNIRNGILAASILGFITSFNQVPVSLFLSGPGTGTLPIAMLWYMENNYDPSIAVLSTLLALLSFAVIMTAERLLKLSRYV